MFTSDVRAVAERITRDHYGLGIAHCIELGGLQGAAVRAFLAGLLLLRRGKPMKVFSDPSEASAWIASQLARSEGSWTGSRVMAIRDAVAKSRVDAALGRPSVDLP